MEKSYLSRFFDEGMDKASSLIDGARKTWDSIDFDAIKEKLNTYASGLYDSAMKFGGNKPYYSIKEYASIMSVTPQTIYNRIHAGDIPAVKIGNTWRISAANI